MAPELRPATDGDPQKLLDRWTRLHPPVFGGERHEDVQDFIGRCRDRLHNMRILESHGVDFTTFQLEGKVRRWWQSYLLGRPAGSPPMTWSQFTQLFLDMYIPPSKREELRYLFEQGHMSVIDYEVRFSKLSRHALMILPTDAERIRRFVAGLHSGIRANMAREVEMGTSYQLVVETARRIEGYRQRWKEKMQQDKRVHFSGEFRGQFGRGQPSKPPYSSPRPPRGAPARPYFSATPESSYRPQPSRVLTGGYSGHQGSSSSYFSSMPESSYRPPAIQDSSSGSTGHQGQTSGQQITAPRGYFECRDLGHMKRFCPRLRGKAMPHDIPHESLGTHVFVSTLVGDSVVVDWIYRSCVVTFCGYKTRANLLLLDMIDFEVILGMGYLSPDSITLAMPELPRLEWKGSSVITASRVISFLKARHMVEKGCLDYLAYVRDTTAEPPTIDSVPVVREFADVFPSDLPDPSRVLACVVAQSSLLWYIKARQFDDPHLAVLRETVLQGGAKEVSTGKDGVLRLQGRLYVPNVDGLREMILEEE
ncbi:uncharacterized protein [Nicotiana tomentosiformis]|uniref:uncharacterized protein n=1 Tax=Nicotiana tomentosiformis TaxID=4098 RepID=UPI00388CB5AF